MRLPIATVLITALALPASASAGTVALEGTELVYRGDAAHERLVIMAEGEAVTFELDRAPVAGCPPTGCSAAGVTAIRVLSGAGDDTVVTGGPLPLNVDLGPGDDELIAGAGPKTLTLSAGPGDDRVEATPAERATVFGEAGRDSLYVDAEPDAIGPFLIDGGADADEIHLFSRAPGTTLAGGDGNDEVVVVQFGPPVTITCGPGNDTWLATVGDVVGEGCAPQLSGITPGSVSRAFREGRLAASASGSVTFRRRVRDQGRPREVIARGTFTAQPGALRVSLKPTSIGRRWLRRDPRLTVFVAVRTRAGGDRGETIFNSRIAR